MKKAIVFLMLFGLFAGSQAQNSAVVSAYNYLKFGQVMEAKESIDKATKHEKTMNVAKTWWYRGWVYHALNDSCMYGKKNPGQYCTIAPDAIQITLNSYIKALILNLKDPKWHTLDILNKEADQKAFGLLMSDQKNIDNFDVIRDIILMRFPPLANSFVNKGVLEYQSEDASKNVLAVESFETSLFLSGMSGKIDTPIVNYLAIASQKAKNWPKAIDAYEELIKLKYGANEAERVGFMYQLARCYRDKGDTTLFLSTLSKGIDKYPNDNTDLITELINYYLVTNKTQDALTYLELAISKSPENSSFHFAQGSLFDKKLTDMADKPFNKIRAGMKLAELKSIMGDAGKSTVIPTKPPLKSEKIEYPDGEVIIENTVVKTVKDNNVPAMVAQISEFEKAAISAYSKAIQLKPDFFDPNYNLGALYFNKGVRYNEVANAISDMKLYEIEKKNADDQFKLAMPYLEKALEIEGSNQNTLSSLKTLYFRMRNESPELMAKYQKIQAILDAQK